MLPRAIQFGWLAYLLQGIRDLHDEIFPCQRCGSGNIQSHAEIHGTCLSLIEDIALYLLVPLDDGFDYADWPLNR